MHRPLLLLVVMCSGCFWVTTKHEGNELRKDVDPRQVAEMYLGIFYVTTRLWLTEYWDDDTALEDRMVRAMDVMMNGMRPRARSRAR